MTTPHAERATAQRHARAWAAVAALLASLAATPAMAQTTHALIVEPVGSERLAGMAAQFDAWKKSGLISSVKLLKAQAGQKDAGFSTLAVVSLPSEKAYAAWSTQVQPELPQGGTVRRADLIKHEGKPSTTPARAVHVASFYATHVPQKEYSSYTTSYITPNMNLQRASGIMSQYTMYMEREPVAGKVRSLLVMEYADGAAYERREKVKADGKQQLAANAEWKRINDIKETIRTDISSTAANEIKSQTTAQR